MPTSTIKPILREGGSAQNGELTIGQHSEGRTYILYKNGGAEANCEPMSRSLDYGGVEKQTGLLATGGLLKDAVVRIRKVARLSSAIPVEDIDNAFSQRMGFSCEEMREEHNVSDYVSLSDYIGPVSYKTRMSETRMSDVTYDGAPICWEDTSNTIKTEYTASWVEPVVDTMLTKQRKGDMIDILIEYVNLEPVGGVFQPVKKCSVQRFDLGGEQPPDDGLMYRKVYDHGSSETASSIAFKNGDSGPVKNIQTCYVDDAHNERYADLSILFPCVSRTGVFLVAFNKNRLTVYCTSDYVSEFKITSCRAIRSIGTEYIELGVFRQNEGEDPEPVMTEYEIGGAPTQSAIKYIASIHD